MSEDRGDFSFYGGMLEGNEMILNLMDHVLTESIKNLEANSGVDAQTKKIAVRAVTNFSRSVKKSAEKGMSIYKAAIKQSPNDIEGYYKEIALMTRNFNSYEVSE